MKPLVGKIHDRNGSYNRDAIHVPIMPVVASEDLNPGQKISLTQKGEFIVATKVATKAKSTKQTLAIVDPYINGPIKSGDGFYAWIKPGTVQKLWHEWSHPFFDK